MTRTRILATLVALTLGMGVTLQAKPAQAQVEIDDETRSLITTLLVGTTASLSVYVLQRLTDRLLDKAFSDAERYMRENSAALRQDIGVGGGETLADLSTILGVPEHEQRALAGRARAQRAAVLPLFRGEATSRDEVVRFVALVLTPDQRARIER